MDCPIGDGHIVWGRGGWVPLTGPIYTHGHLLIFGIDNSRHAGEIDGNVLQLPWVLFQYPWERIDIHAYRPTLFVPLPVFIMEGSPILEVRDILKGGRRLH